MPTSGWPLVGYAAASVAFVTGAILWTYGAGEEGLRASARVTARISALLFLLPFLASSLRTLRRTSVTAWLVRNRRYLGVSFGASQTIHLAIVVSLSVVAGRSPDLTTLIAGVIGYTFVAAMVATSFDRSAAWLGPARWRTLHVTGLYYLWAVFAFLFAASSGWTARVVLALLLLSLAARLWLRRGRPTARSGDVG
jgi:hypothetical protein